MPTTRRIVATGIADNRKGWLFRWSNVKHVGRELGVRYVLEGSVRKGGGRVRITAQLIDAETGPLGRPFREQNRCPLTGC
jgi:TolB-like protein